MDSKSPEPAARTAKEPPAPRVVEIEQGAGTYDERDYSPAAQRSKDRPDRGPDDLKPSKPPR